MLFNELQMCVVFPLEMESSPSWSTVSASNDANTDDNGEWNTVSSNNLPEWDVSPTELSNNTGNENWALQNAQETVEYLMNNLEIYESSVSQQISNDSGYTKSNSNLINTSSYETVDEETWDEHCKKNDDADKKEFSSKKQLFSSPGKTIEVNLHTKINKSAGKVSYPETSSAKKKKKGKQNDCEDNDDSPSNSVKVLNHERSVTIKEPIDTISVENIDYIKENEQHLENNISKDNCSSPAEQVHENETSCTNEKYKDNLVIVGQNLELDASAANETNLEVNNFNSREALYDENSQVDSLEDFHIDVQNYDEQDEMHRPILFQSVTISTSHDGLVVTENMDNFPNWLLQLLIVDEAHDFAVREHDEPHFYCQGDGIGVHPSYVEEDEDDDDDDDDNEGTDENEDTEEGSIDSNSQNSTHGEVTTEQSDTESDVGSLPDDANENQNKQVIKTSLLVNSPIPEHGSVENINRASESPPLDVMADLESTFVDNASLDATLNTAGSSSVTESTDEFFESNVESESPKNNTL